MTTRLRRQAHIYENMPGNISATLMGPFRQARPGSYFADPSNPPEQSEVALFHQPSSAHSTSYMTSHGQDQQAQPQTQQFNLVDPQTWGLSTWSDWDNSGSDVHLSFPVLDEEDDHTDSDTSSDDQ